MKEEIFKIGYVPYLEKKKTKEHKWTSAIFNRKTIIIAGIVISTCVITNCILIYKFITILETNNIIL